MTLALVCLGMVAAGSATAQEASAYYTALTDWAEVLETFVDEEGRTDFAALADSPGMLQRFVDVLAETGPNSEPDAFGTEAAQLAFYINAYNALAMHGVISEAIPADFAGFFKRLAFFKNRKVQLDGKTTDLYALENKVIRPYGDARIHFALNCMVKDCPRLPRQPFTADELEAQLQSAAIEFFSKPRHLRIDTAKRQVEVSEILKFYTRDFVASGRRQDLPTYFNAFLESPVPEDFAVRYIPYDWTINQQP